jgi:hypothetical protein
MSTTSPPELEMPMHPLEETTEQVPLPEASASPPEPRIVEIPSAAAPEPEPERPSEHPPNWDPIRDGGEPGTYTADGRRFDTLTAQTQPRLRKEKRREWPEAESFWSRLRPSLRAEPIAGWTLVAVIALGLFLLACFHYVAAISDSQGRLDAKLTGRQDQLDTRQRSLDGRQAKLEGRQNAVQGQIGKLQSDVEARTGGLYHEVQRLQGTVSGLGREMRGGLKELDQRLERDERQQSQRQATPSVSGTVLPGRQSNLDQNPPVATLPMQRPADAGSIDTHDNYAVYEDTVPGGRAKLGIDSSGKKYYELSYTDPRTNTTYPNIDVRPYGSSTAGTLVHVIRGNGPIREGQHWMISPSGGWMGPVPQ